MNRSTFSAVCAVLALMLVNRSDASIMTMNLGGSEFSASGASSIASNEIVLTFDDGIVAGAVQLKIQFNGGSGVNTGAKINSLVLNLDPSKSISSFAKVSGVSVGSAAFSQNAYNSDGSKGYDVKFDYPTSNGSQFAVGSTSIYNMFGVGLSVASFDVTNASDSPNYNKGPFHAAAHINEVNVGKSGHYSDSSISYLQQIPEPGSIAVWAGFCIFGIAYSFRRQKLVGAHAKI